MDVRTIPEFPNYFVSDDGRVFNAKTDREMVLSPTMQGELTVGLVRDGVQYRRSVKVLVAWAFVDGWTEVFNTPIQLDGNKTNLEANNIRWRPRWFAWKYAHQFSDNPPSYYFIGPIFDVVNSVEYNNILQAAMETGSLCEDIHYSVLNESHVFPNGERYIYL